MTSGVKWVLPKEDLVVVINAAFRAAVGRDDIEAVTALVDAARRAAQ
jgi:hypothetical protein